MIAPYVVAYTAIGTLSLTYQKLFSGNASYYDKLSAKELEWIGILDDLMVEHLIRRFSPVQKIRPKEYFRKHFNPDEHKASIRPYIESVIHRFLRELPDQYDGLYTADEINPASKQIQVSKDFTRVLFHFRRNEHGTSYFVTLKHNDEKVPFMKQHGLLLTNKPATLVVNRHLYRFYDFVDGSKLAVFLNKKFIHIKPESEAVYYDRFIRPLLETAPVFAQGFEIETRKENASPAIQCVQQGGRYYIRFLSCYDGTGYVYHPSKLYHVQLIWHADDPRFIRYKVSRQWEENRLSALQALGLQVNEEGLLYTPEMDLQSTVQFMRDNKEVLEASGFELQSTEHEPLSFERPKVNYRISDKQDWFDIEIDIQVGEYTIPFRNIIAAMKKGLDRIVLPNGKALIFSASWYGLSDVLSSIKPKQNTYTVKKYQLNILEQIESKRIRSFVRGIVDIRKEDPHPNFKGKLRPYQVDGLSWLMFLYNNHFGGILADDMGLGKTIQTLAFLQRVKDTLEPKAYRTPFLLVAPTSLLYNWKNEAQQFTPDLTVHIHSGARRVKELDKMPECDIIITSYGLVRNDFELLSQLEYEIMVMDESQNLKNSRSKVAQRLSKFVGKTKIALTGTPIENTVQDLWSQMNILNPGMLSTQKRFHEKFVKPIEKEQDEERSRELQRRIKPFVLRRTKEEVAHELPPVTEQIIYCEMTEEQAELYDEVRSEYRNALLDMVESKGIEKSKLSILQGLSRLRQIANHPGLIGQHVPSGKHEIVLDHICTALEEHHKVLVFSQFVSYLDLLSKDLNKKKIAHHMLTGSTPKEKRQSMVEAFQEDDEVRMFLISLKAGGTGLNLTAADYVFIVDPWWNPAAEAQARDRSHRIGQTRSVFSYKFISRDTIEEKILRLQSRKKTYAKELIKTENNILQNLEVNDISELFT